MDEYRSLLENNPFASQFLKKPHQSDHTVSTFQTLANRTPRRLRPLWQSAFAAARWRDRRACWPDACALLELLELELRPNERPFICEPATGWKRCKDSSARLLGRQQIGRRAREREREEIRRRCSSKGPANLWRSSLATIRLDTRNQLIQVEFRQKPENQASQRLGPPKRPSEGQFFAVFQSQTTNLFGKSICFLASKLSLKICSKSCMRIFSFSA